MDNMDVLDIREVLAIKNGNFTYAYLFLLGTSMVYLSSMGYNYVRQSMADVNLVLFVFFWLGYPIALYFDKKFVTKNSDWSPSKAYYIGFVPTLGLVVIAYYIQKRQKILQ